MVRNSRKHTDAGAGSIFSVCQGFAWLGKVPGPANTHKPLFCTSHEQKCFSVSFFFFLPKAVLQRGPFFSSLVKLKPLCSMPNHIQRPSVVILYQKMVNALYSKKKNPQHMED